jgi:oligoendopeptidase F
MTQYKPSKWDLVDLFPGYDSTEMKDAFKQLKTAVTQFEEFREKLKSNMDLDEFYSLVKQQESWYRLIGRISQFSGLWFSENTQNQNAIAFQGKVQQFVSELKNRVIFFSLWWKSLSDAEAVRFIEHAGEYTYWLNQIRKFKPYTLTEAEEKIINIKNVTGSSSIIRLYNMLTNRYVFEVEVDGEMKKLTRGELMSLVFGSDSDVRSRAYQELYKVYGDDGLILGQMYQTIVRDFHNENIDLRKYQHPISWRNLNNDVPDEVVDTLLEVAKKNTAIFQRYFKLKAKWLKMDKLRRYDIYAPITSSVKKYEFDEAANLVLKVFNDFDPKLKELAKRVLDQNHLDSEIRQNKRGGAFCSSSDPELTPYVLVNYNGKADDIATLAHELGHAIHAMLAENHNVFNYHSSLPLAETASTFSEMLLIDELLATETDEEVRRDILFGQIADNYATIMRQIFFALFEKEAHNLITEDVSVDRLCEKYMENLKLQFGDSLELSDEFRWEWVSIPHLYLYPFYVYAYSFGQLLVLSLYQQYKNEGKSFIARYLEMLAAGGSKSPVDILDRAGFNVRNPEFWQGGFDVLSEMVSQLEAIPIDD